MKPIKYALNTVRVIACLEDKARCSGWRYIIPEDLALGKQPIIHGKGKVGIKTVERIDLDDFGVIKPTIVTKSKYDQSKYKHEDRTDYGVYNDKISGAFFGKKSSHFRTKEGTLESLFEDLNKGFSLAPAYFLPYEKPTHESEESYRSIYSLREVYAILFDADEWTKEHPAPETLAEFYERYPDIKNDFFMISESISSRSSLKPEYRFRLGLAFPFPLQNIPEYNENNKRIDPKLGLTSYTFEYIVYKYRQKYPFIAESVAKDMSRFSFGNARQEAYSEFFGNNCIPEENFKQYLEQARVQFEVNKNRIEENRERKEKKENRKKKTVSKAREMVANDTLKPEEFEKIDPKNDPILTYKKENPDIEKLFKEEFHAEHITGINYHWKGSSTGMSFQLDKDTLKPFSNTINSKMPSTAKKNRPIDAWRFFFYNKYEKDITIEAEKQELCRLLAEDGYGIFFDKEESKKVEKKVVKEIIANKSIDPDIYEDLQKSYIKPIFDLAEKDQVLIIESGEIQKMLEKVFDTLDLENTEARLFCIKAPTGSGKTHNKETFIKEEGLKIIDLTPNLKLGKESLKRYETRGIDAKLWRSRLSEYKEKEYHKVPIELRTIEGEGSIMCIDGERCLALSKKGGNPNVSICPECPALEMCNEIGYRSQYKKLEDKSVIILAKQDVITDPRLEFFLKRIKADEEDRSAFIDEIKTHDLFLECTIHKSQLKAWSKMWENELLGDFANEILEIVGEDNIYEKIKEIYQSFAEREAIPTIIEQTGKIRIKGKLKKEDYILNGDILGHFKLAAQGHIYVVPKDKEALDILNDHSISTYYFNENKQLQEGTFYLEMSLEQAIDIKIYPISNDQDIVKYIPRVYNGKCTPIDMLKTFFEYYKISENAPIQNTKNSFTFFIPPILTEKIDRLLTMSATLNEEHMKKLFYEEDIVYKSIDEVISFAKGSKCYQHEAAYFPKGTLLVPQTVNNQWQYNELSETGEFYVEWIRKLVEKTPDQRFCIVTTMALQSLIENTLNYENLTAIIHYGEEVGLDTLSDEADIFIVLGSFEPKPDILVIECKKLYGDEEQPLTFERTDERFYIDQRVQSVYETLVIDSIKQAAGRARLNVKENKTLLLFTAHFIPEYSFFAKPFQKMHLEVCDTLEELDIFIENWKNYLEMQNQRESFIQWAYEDFNFTINDLRIITGFGQDKLKKICKNAQKSLAQNILSSFDPGVVFTAKTVIDSFGSKRNPTLKAIKKLIKDNLVIEVDKNRFKIKEF